MIIEDKHWRNTLNSTDVVSCPNPESCKGGYEPDGMHPVSCSEGYTGVL